MVPLPYLVQKDRIDLLAFCFGLERCAPSTQKSEVNLLSDGALLWLC